MCLVVFLVVLIIDYVKNNNGKLIEIWESCLLNR